MLVLSVRYIQELAVGKLGRRELVFVIHPVQLSRSLVLMFVSLDIQIETPGCDFLARGLR